MFQLVATLMIGVLAASVTFILYRISPRFFPRVIIPFAAAIAMIAYNIWHETTWYARTSTVLTEEFVLLGKGEPVKSLMSPWTFVVPRTDNFFALDKRTIQPLPNSDGRYLVQVLDVGRFYPAKRTSRIVDCTTREQAMIDAATKFDADGLPADLKWTKITAGNRLADEVCPGKAEQTPTPPAN